MLEGILEAIHEECFPRGYKMMLHKELMSATQGNLEVREFGHKLRSLAKRLPYVNDQCLAAIFFVGVHKYIRAGLILEKMKQDSADLETLVKCASKYEDAQYMMRDASVSESTGQIPHNNFVFAYALQAMEMRRPTSYCNNTQV